MTEPDPRSLWQALRQDQVVLDERRARILRAALDMHAWELVRTAAYLGLAPASLVRLLRSRKRPELRAIGVEYERRRAAVKMGARKLRTANSQRTRKPAVGAAG